MLSCITCKCNLMAARVSVLETLVELLRTCALRKFSSNQCLLISDRVNYEDRCMTHNVKDIEAE